METEPLRSNGGIRIRSDQAEKSGLTNVQMNSEARGGIRSQKLVLFRILGFLRGIRCLVLQ